MILSYLSLKLFEKIFITIYLFQKKKGTRSARGNNLIRFNIFNEPEKTAFPSIAFKVAAWFWKENAYVIKSTDPAGKSSLNELADGTFLSFAQLTHSLTNKIKSLKERANLNEQILAQFQSVSMKRGRGVTCEIKSETELGYAVPICLIDFKKPYCGCEGKIERRTCAYGRLKSGACRNSLMIKCCYEKCHTNLDLVILMDKSGSVTEEGFEKEKNFVKELINQLDIGINATRLSIIDFDNKVTKHMDFNDVQTNKAALDVVNSLKIYGGKC